MRSLKPPHSYRFSLHAPHHILGLPIGQHLTVEADLDKKTSRSYTPISSDEDPGFFDLLIKTYPQGAISKHVSTLSLGQTLRVKGPKGQMVYTPGMVKRLGMIAGGTGITPMLQIIRAISRGRPKLGGNDTTEVDLIFANVNEEDILLKGTLDKLAAEDPGFRVHYVLNNPPEKWNGGVGFVTADLIKVWLHASKHAVPAPELLTSSQTHFPAPADDIKILVCGPKPMVDAMKAATLSLGYDKARPAVSKLEDQVFCF